jgi:hypothetical protein
MTSSTISQPLNNVALPNQSGSEFVAKAAVNFSGGDALVGVSASAWSNNAGLMSMEVWLDEQPTGALLQMYANTPAMHLALGHTWVWLQGMSAGLHTIALLAGETTVTDGNDSVCVTVWEMGDGTAVRFADDAPGTGSGNGQQLINADFQVSAPNNPVVISASASGWVTSAASLISGWVPIDGGDPVRLDVFANNAEQHLAMVPTDYVITQIARGLHQVELNADGLTTTDQNDTAHLSVVELLAGPAAPVVQGQLQNATAQAQQGDGGSIASFQFESNGGPLLVRTSASVWTEQEGELLYVGIQIDGTSKGYAQVFANFTETHMGTVTNDLVVEGIGAGTHTLNLMAEANVITDQNDRVSVLILEFPQS